MPLSQSRDLALTGISAVSPAPERQKSQRRLDTLQKSEEPLMRDYYPLLSTVVEALEGSSAEVRRRLYESVRTGFLEQMRKREPPLPDSYISQQQIALEEAIRRVEKEQMSRPPRREAVPAPAKSGIAVPAATEEISSSSVNPGDGRVDPDQTEVEGGASHAPAPPG